VKREAICMDVTMKKILYIADPEILAVPIVECEEPLIDIKDYDELRYGPPPECELTAGCYTKMRKTAYEKLCQAQKQLPKGWRFQLYEGFRSLSVQQMLFEQIYNQVVSRDPKKNHQENFIETTKLVSPVINLDGSRNIPAHNTGGAIDIEIIMENGQLADMGMAAKDWCNVAPDLCSTGYTEINETAKKNRKLLFDLLTAHGFINYPTEWWHYSYGDRYWGYHQKIKQAIYGSVEEFTSSCSLDGARITREYQEKN
jgi:D-alanyl-D-alanine dipeptidase